MAKLTNLTTLAKTSVVSTDYLLVTNSTSQNSKKISVATLFPAFATSGAGSEDIWVSVTNKNQLNFKGIKSGDTGLLTVATTTNNIVLTALEAGIDLSLCNNVTSGFLSDIDFTGVVSGENSVINGGTGLATIAKGAILYASATDTIAATAVPTNGQVLIGNASTGVPAWNTLTAGANITTTETAGVITLAASLATLTADLDTDTYDINLNAAAGASWISGNGNSEGLTVNADGKVFIGEDSPTAAFVSALNIKGSIEFTNDAAPVIKPTTTLSTNVGMEVTIEGGNSVGGAAGHLNLTGGTATGTAAGGSVIITGGQDTGGSTNGSVQLKTYNSSTATAGLTVASTTQDVTVNTGNLIITAADKGIVHTGSGTVTQATDHTTGCTIHSTSGVITLAAVALAATTNAQFIFTNSTIQADSVILLTMQDNNTVDNKQLACALVAVNAGNCHISIVNPHSASATSATASKIHFLVINNS